MFKRTKPQLDITDHPEVITALNAMWQQAYEAGRRDALAIVTDFAEQERADRALTPTGVAYLEGIAAVIERLEQDASG